MLGKTLSGVPGNAEGNFTLGANIMGETIGINKEISNNGSSSEEGHRIKASIGGQVILGLEVGLDFTEIADGFKQAWDFATGKSDNKEQPNWQYIINPKIKKLNTYYANKLNKQ